MNHYRVSFENAERAPGRAEAVSFQGEWLLVVWAGALSNEALINVERLEEEAGHIAHIRSYYFLSRGHSRDRRRDRRESMGVAARPKPAVTYPIGASRVSDPALVVAAPRIDSSDPRCYQ
jgi:hypothetical protein